MRLSRTDVAVAALLTAVLQLEVWLREHYEGGVAIPGPRPATAALLLVATAAVAFRRARPALAAVVSLGAVAVLSAAFGGPEAAGLFALFIVVVYSGAAWAPRPEPVAVAAVVTLLVHGLRDPFVHSVGDAVFAPLVAAVAFALGLAQRGRVERHRRAEARADVAEAERDAAVAAERARIARDLHDIVSHSVSVMVLQAAAAERLLDRDPDAAREPLAQVQATGREAIAELRRMLGLLRTAGEGAEREPTPGLARVPALVEDLRSTGQPVELVVDGPARPLAPGVDLAAFRVVQEGLTNVRKHAGGAPARVVLRRTEGGVRVEVADAGGPAVDGASGSGLGLVGLRERVEFFGGRLQAGRREDGGFSLTAELPA